MPTATVANRKLRVRTHRRSGVWDELVLIWGFPRGVSAGVVSEGEEGKVRLTQPGWMTLKYTEQRTLSAVSAIVPVQGQNLLQLEPLALLK